MVIKKLHEKCTDILYNRLLGYPLNNEDSSFLMSIFPLHPRFIEKVAGREIKCIIVRRNETYHNKCFALVFSDGGIEDISFVKCLGRISEVRNNIKSACKKIIPDVSDNLIIDWIRTFRYQDISLYQYIVYPEIVFNNQGLINQFQQFVIDKTQSKSRENLTNKSKTLNNSEIKTHVPGEFRDNNIINLN